MEWIALVIVVPMVVAFAAELFLLDVTRKRLKFLRWVPLAPVPVLVALAVACWREGSWLWELGVALYGGVAVLYLLGWGIAWGVYALWRKA